MRSSRNRARSILVGAGCVLCLGALGMALRSPDNLAGVESRYSGQVPANGRTSGQPPSKSSRPRPSEQEPLWNQIERAKDEYVGNFEIGGVGSASRMWLNSKNVMFWCDQLSSPDAARVDMAIGVFEAAAEYNLRHHTDSSGNVQPNGGLLEKEAESIFFTMINARSQVFMFRSAVNQALEQAKDDEQIAKIESGIIAQIECDDGRVFSDARMVIESFVPRLSSDDSGTSDAARRVLGLFTYELFSEEDAKWWNSTLIRLRKGELGRVLD